jgi:hypothetical protein
MTVSKKEAQEALNRLVDFFQNYQGEFFGLDDCGIIDLYINKVKLPI